MKREGEAGEEVTRAEVCVAACADAWAGDGEILVRGPLTTPGYLNRPDLTADLIDPDGWLHTGDIGKLDDDGFVSVVDRKKELIITAGGENIAPAAIESLLVAHPLIGNFPHLLPTPFAFEIAEVDLRRRQLAVLRFKGVSGHKAVDQLTIEADVVPPFVQHRDPVVKGRNAVHAMPFSV